MMDLFWLFAGIAFGAINGFYAGDHLAWLKMAEYAKRNQSDALRREKAKVEEREAELRRLVHLVDHPYQALPVKRPIDVASSLRLYGIDPLTTESPDARVARYG
jgi:hypothetical protein